MPTTGSKTGKGLAQLQSRISSISVKASRTLSTLGNAHWNRSIGTGQRSVELQARTLEGTVRQYLATQPCHVKQVCEDLLAFEVKLGDIRCESDDKKGRPTFFADLGTSVHFDRV
ncbi:hypothetical protein DOTSEDRAFT_70972 [Dothistroma septosporum NZE10]|uniref:Uncharacterized protein n=1 Tax=Dothistroma septosporum (strain NZE10 / CBS 128990) TaxID=675120 RepID=N1PRV5_DOTSN|nr:hypothetical protein DOTSEDRAFT_70972 [Dothistroma septosporum NZE10]